MKFPSLRRGKAHGLAAAFEKVPDLIDKYVETMKKKEEELV